MGFWTDTLCTGMAGVYTFFGATLAISMRDFWGDRSPGFSYWSVEPSSGDHTGQWFARAAGIWMVAITTSPYWAGMNKKTLAKIYLPINLVFMGMFCDAAFNLEPNVPEGNVLPVNMWYTQLPVAAFFLFANIKAIGEGKTNKD